jgi:signal transduction histidine kinase
MWEGYKHLGRRMKLRTKLAIVLLAITVLLSVATTGGLELYKQQQIEETEESVNETADLTANQIGESIRRFDNDLSFFAGRTNSSQFDLTREEVDTYLTNTQFWAAEVIEANGTVTQVRGDVTEEFRQDRLRSNLSGEPVLEVPLGEFNASYVSDPTFSPNRGTYVITISRPIFYENETERGVLAVALDLSTTTLFQTVPPLETSTQSVRIVDGNETLHPEHETFQQRISGSNTVESTGWRVVVTRDASGLTTQLRNLAIAQAGGLGAVLLLVIGLGYWQYTSNLRQTERLLEGFGEVREGNYEYSLSLGAGEEWVQISDGFNDLSMGLKRREERLREREQRLEVLYRVLRHNLRNEMSIVQNYAGIINDMSGEEPIRDAAQTILDAGEDLVGLSEKARQIENALQEASTEPTTLDAAGVVREIADDMREEYPDVDLRASIPETAWVSAIPSLQLAIENVCENACKHNDADDPVVEVSVDANGADGVEQGAEAAGVEADGGTATGADGDAAPGDDTEDAPGEVTIEVSDNGPGIPEQDRNVLKEGRETALEHGSGLGLWLVYWVVDKSGGVLGFDENEPRGSIVTVELDAAAPPEAPGDDSDVDGDDDDVPGSPDDESTDAFA